MIFALRPSIQYFHVSLGIVLLYSFYVWDEKELRLRRKISTSETKKITEIRVSRNTSFSMTGTESVPRQNGASRGILILFKGRIKIKST